MYQIKEYEIRVGNIRNICKLPYYITTELFLTKRFTYQIKEFEIMVGNNSNEGNIVFGLYLTK